MAIKLKLKNSVVKDKAPTPADLDIGELALNAHQDSPAAYIKDAAGVVRKIAGVGSVSTPTASDTVQGIVELATPAEATAGADATRAVTPAGLKTALAAQAGSPTAPAGPVVGQVWVDSSTSPSTIKVWGGTPPGWIAQAGATVTSATAPATPAKGQIWIDTSASPSVTKIWDGTAWVTATADGSAAAAIANDAKYATKAELQAEDLWDRTGTEISPRTAGDSVFTLGEVKIGGTTAAPNFKIKAGGWMEAYGSHITLSRNNTPNDGIFLEAGDTGPGNRPSIKIKGNATATPEQSTAFEVAYDNGVKPSLNVRYDGTVRIGGTLPASPNITLKADGSLAAKGNFDLGGVGKDGRLRFRRSSDGNALAEVGVHTADASLDIYNGADGGPIKFSVTQSSAPKEAARIAAIGDFLLGGTLPASPNTKLDAAGNVFCKFLSWTTAPANVFMTYQPTTQVHVQNATPNTGVALAVGATTWSPYTSESRLKDFVADPDPDQCWTLIRDIELKRYYYKDQDDKSGVSYMGPMADWLGLQDPELLIDTGRTDEHGPIHTYNQGLLDMKALAALSAALKRIEDLETRLAALEPAKTPTP